MVRTKYYLFPFKYLIHNLGSQEKINEKGEATTGSRKGRGASSGNGERKVQLVHITRIIML